MSDQENPCYLSELTPELMDNILLEIDSVRDLGNLILASRHVLQCFEGRKHAIIWRVLQRELGPVVKDAKFLRLFPYADPGGSRDKWMAYWDDVHNMAAVYRDILDSGHETVPSLAELTQLCRTLHDMNFLASTYITAQLRSFSGVDPACAPPSRVERLRVLRALYRRQIICNAWAPTRRQPHWTLEDLLAIGNTSEHRGNRLGLYAAFEAWELQQVDHADWFIKRLCAALCLAAAGEDSAHVAESMDEATFGDILSHADLLVKYMRKHPQITDAVLRALLSPLQPRRRGSFAAEVSCSQHLKRYSLPCLQVA